MSNEITTTTQTKPAKVSVINALAAKLECDPKNLIPILQKTAFSACRTDEEFQVMCMVANTYELNPLLKQIYAFPAKNGAIVPVVGVDGWLTIMNKHPQFDGIDFEDEPDGCTCIIYRKDRSHPTRVKEFVEECRRSTDAWKMTHRMIRNRAICQAGRIAFGITGIMLPEEAETIEAEVVDNVTKVQKPTNLRQAIGLEPIPEPEATVEAETAQNAQEPAPVAADAK